MLKVTYPQQLEIRQTVLRYLYARCGCDYTAAVVHPLYAAVAEMFFTLPEFNSKANREI